MMDKALKSVSKAMARVEKEGLDGNSQCRIPCRLTTHNVVQSITSYTAGEW